MKKYLLLTIFLLSASSAWAVPLGTEFTYQGELKQSGTAPTGIYDFEFRLYDAIAAGIQVGSTQSVPNVAVDEGLFTV